MASPKASSSKEKLTSPDMPEDGSKYTDTANAKGKRKEAKKRKVGQACVYCRRSHMTCDSQRPCNRCVKRDIGHLCHDETPGKVGHGHAHHAMPKNKPSATTSSSDPTSTKSASPAPIASSMPEAGPSLSPPLQPAMAHNQPLISNPNPAELMSLLPSMSPDQKGGPAVRAGDALQAYISALTASAPSNGMFSPQSSVGALHGSTSTAFRPGAAAMEGPRQSLGGLSSDVMNTLVSASNGAAPGGPSLLSSGMADGTAMGNQLAGIMASSSWPTMTSSAAGIGGAGFLGLGGSHGADLGGSGRGGDAAGGNEYNLLSEFLESLDGPLDANANSSNPNLDVGPSTSTNTSPVMARASPWAPSSSSKLQHEITPDNTVYPRRSKRSRPSSPAAGNSQLQGLTPLKRIATAQSPEGPNADGKTTPGSSSYPSSSSLSTFSTKTEKFFLTAADQVDGPRQERLSRVIQAKYDAGLLRPYNHVKGYARLSSWMERNVSPASRRRILKPLSVFRPRFRAVAQSLSDVDLIYIEEAFERLLLDYDRVFSTQGIPACLWRRTGEVYKGNREFAELMGVGVEELREGRLCIYELMEEESACNYWEKYGAVSFDPGQKAVLTSCVLIPRSRTTTSGGTFSRPVTNAQNTPAPGGGLFTGNATGQNSARASVSGPAGESTQTASSPTSPASVAVDTPATATPGRGTSVAATAGTTGVEKGQQINCCFSFTIRRDSFGVPTAIVGNFLPLSPSKGDAARA